MTTRYKFPRFRAPLHLVADNDNHKPDGPKGPRPVSKLTDAELQALEENFVKKGVTESPHYTLQEVRRERLRRATKESDGREVVGHIITLAAVSPDYLTTYGALHATLWPNEQFSGHASIGKIKKALGAAILYCVENGLPCVTTLVVHANTRSLSERATQNVYDTLKGLGVEVGDSAEDYVLEQTLAAMDLVAQSAMAKAA